MIRTRQLTSWQTIGFFVLLSVVLRGFYWWYNSEYFVVSGVREALTIWGVGLRYDLGIWTVMLMPAIGLFVLISFFQKPWLKALYQWCVRLAVIAFIIANVMDAFYYPFNFHRATWYDVQILADSTHMIGDQILSHPVALVVLLIIIFAICWIRFYTPKKWSWWQLMWVPFVWWSVFGFSKKIIAPKDTLVYVTTTNSNIASNTVWSIMNSYYYKFIMGLDESLPARHYFPDEDIQKTRPVRRQETPWTNDGSKPNFVLFVMESFSASFLDSSSPYKAPTPFFDSIMRNSWVCSNAYANSYSSSRSLSAIVTGVPALLDYPFFESEYKTIRLETFPMILKANGYTNSFYFGGNENHFGWKNALAPFGIDHYHSGEELGVDYQKYNDGLWGVYDGVFLKYFSEQLHKTSVPFFSVFFNLSSHYPFKIPTDYNPDLFKGNKIQAHQSIRYVDAVMKDFFDRIRTLPWFSNTYFIFVGDHSSREQSEETYDYRTFYKVPLIIYKPDGSLRHNETRLVEQIDIGPTVLQLMGYNGVYYNFGESILKENRHKNFTLNTKDKYRYEYIDSTFIAHYYELKDTLDFIYNYRTDPSLSHNLVNDVQLYTEYKNKIQLELQNFSYRILQNKMH